MSLNWHELDQLVPRNEWRVPLPPACPACGYNLTGLTDNRCPECGGIFIWREVQRQAARAWSQAVRLRHANQDSRTGLMMASAGWIGLGLAVLAGPGVFSALLHIGAFGAAVMAVVLGAQVLNLRRVPTRLRVYISTPPPSMALGAAVMLLGLTLMFGSLVVW